MKKDFAIADIPVGTLNALVKNLMRQTGTKDPAKAIRWINSGKWTAIESMKNWHEKDDLIYLTVTSDGTTGEEWIKRLEAKGHFIKNHHDSTELLLSLNFKPTKGVTTKVAIIPGKLVKTRDAIFANDVYVEAQKRNLYKPNIEVGCLIRELISDKEIKAMEIRSILVMSDPIKVGEFNDRVYQLEVGENGIGKSCLYAHCEYGMHMLKSTGYAFAVSQVDKK